jgi:hypothetical protein
MAVATGRRTVFSSYRTDIGVVVRSITKILDELRLRSMDPWAENVNRKASPCGNEEEELVEEDINFTNVCRGRRKASNKFLLASRLTLRLSPVISSDSEVVDAGVEQEGGAQSARRRW